MSKKTEMRKAAYVAARKRAVLPILLAFTVILEEAWTKAGTTEHGYTYEKLEMSPENKARVAKKWAQIVRWRDAFVDKRKDDLATLRKSSAIYRDMREKHELIEKSIMAHTPDGISYGHALSVETIVVSTLIDDWTEMQGWNVPASWLYFRRTLQTLATWTCPPEDAITLLANMVYYDVRDKILESPDWSSMWQNEPLSEVNEYIIAHPEAEFSIEAQKWCRKQFGAAVRAA